MLRIENGVNMYNILKNCCCCCSPATGKEDGRFPLDPRPSNTEGVSLLNMEDSLYTAKYDFTPDDAESISFRAGDKIQLLSEVVPEKEWYRARNLHTREQGNVPILYLGKNLEKELYWFPCTSHSNAETLLLWEGNETGSFLVRESKDPEAPYSLSVRGEDAKKHPVIKHYRINYLNGKYFISPKIQTANLQNLIKAYLLSNTVDLGLCANITKPCARVDPQLYELETSGVEIDCKELDLHDQPFAAGNYSDVYLAKWKNLNVVVKVPKETKFNREHFYKEVRIMKALRHKNIVNFHGICSSGLYYIVLEYMELGCLRDHLRENQLTSNQRIHVATEIASAMTFLESQKIVHRDLAARNILLKTQLRVKLADFGLSRFLSENHSYMPSSLTEVATKWLAPECFRRDGYSGKSDIWAYGILLMEIYSNGESPYKEITHFHRDELVRMIANGYRMQQREGLPDNIYELMMKCWQKNPVERPSFMEIETFFGSYEKMEGFTFAK